MTGLFQIFDRYRSLTRSKSTQKKLANSNGEPAQGAVRDPSCISFAYHMFQDESAQRRATLEGQSHVAQPDVNREPRRSSIDNSEVMAAKALANAKDPQVAVEPKPQPARTSLDSRPKPRLSFYFKEEAPVNDTPVAVGKEILVAVAKEFPVAVAKEPPRDSFSGLLQRRNSDPTVAASRSSVDGKTAGKEDREKKIRDFRGMFRASFLRKEPKVNSQESPGSSFDLEGEQLKGFSSELPAEYKEGFESNGDLSGLDGLAGDDEEKSYRRFVENPKGWIDIRDGSTPRLTVELKEGPQLTRSDDQRGPVEDLVRQSSLQGPGWYIAQKGPAPTPIDFKESMQAIDSKDSWKESMDRARRSVDGKDLPRPSLDGKAVASRLSVDGRPSPRQSVSTPRLSVDGRDSIYNRGPGHYANRSSETSTTTSPRRDNSRAASPRRDSNWEKDLEGSKWKASRVVARLMGLEDLPNFDMVPPIATGMSPSRECKSPQKGFYYIHPEESPHPFSDDFYNLLYQAEEVVAPQLKETPGQTKSWNTSRLPGWQQVNIVSAPPKLRLNVHKELETGGHHTPAPPKHQPMSPKHHMIESMPQVLKHPVEPKSSNDGLLYGDMDQRLRQLGLKNSIQERKTLKQILEAMHLKGLLHPPPHMDNDGKHNFSRQDQSGSVAKSLFHDPKAFPSAPLTTPLKTDLFDLDYKDIPNFRSGPKTKGYKQGGQEYDGSKSPSRGRSFNGEASIVVMKPLNLRPAAKLLTLKPSPNLPQSKEMESMPARGSSVSKKLATMPTPQSTVEKEGSASTSTGVSSKSETVAATIKQRPRSRSVEPRMQNRAEELPAIVRQRRERIAARTAKVTSDADSSKLIRSISPPVAKRAPAAKDIPSGKPIPPARSAFGSSITRTVDGKPRAKPTKDKEEIKTATQVMTRRTKSSRELLKDKTTGEQEASKVLSRSRSDSKLVAGYVERTMSPERLSKSKGPAEVAVPRSKKTTGRTGRDWNIRSSPPSPVNVETVGVSDMLKDKFHLEECKEDRWESTADSYSEIQDTVLNRYQNGAPFVVMSPPFSLPESRRSKTSRHNEDHIRRERQRSEAEDALQQADGDPVHSGRYSRSEVTFDSRRQIEELEPNADVGIQQEPFKEKKLQKGAEDDDSGRPPPAEDGCAVSKSDREQDDLQKTLISQPPAGLFSPVSPVAGITGDPLKDLIFAVAPRSLDLDDQEPYLNKPTLEIQVPYVSDLPTAPATNSVPSSLNTKEDERAYVSHIMVASGVTDDASAPSEWPISGFIISPEFFDQLEEHLELQESARKQNAYLSGEERTEYLKEALARRLLFDSVNNILERKLHPYLNPQPWGGGAHALRPKPTGVELVGQVWADLQELRARALDDDTLYTILQRDFAQRGEKWVDFSTEVGEIGAEIEEMVFDEMMDAAVQELADDCADKLVLRSSSQPQPPCRRRDDVVSLAS